MSTKSSVPLLGRQERGVVFVDPNAGQRGAGQGPPFFGEVGEGDDLDVARAACLRPFGVAGGVPLLHDEAVTDDGTAEGWFHFNFCRVCDRNDIE